MIKLVYIFYIFGNLLLAFFNCHLVLILGNPMGVMIANALAPVIVNNEKDIPFMVCFFKKCSF